MLGSELKHDLGRLLHDPNFSVCPDVDRTSQGREGDALVHHRHKCVILGVDEDAEGGGRFLVIGLAQALQLDCGHPVVLYVAGAGVTEAQGSQAGVLTQVAEWELIKCLHRPKGIFSQHGLNRLHGVLRR